MTTNDGGPAFPARPREQMAGGVISAANEGMSLRDWFAGQALAGLVAHNDRGFWDDLAVMSYKAADAMIAARGAK